MSRPQNKDRGKGRKRHYYPANSVNLTHGTEDKGPYEIKRRKIEGNGTTSSICHCCRGWEGGGRKKVERMLYYRLHKT